MSQFPKSVPYWTKYLQWLYLRLYLYRVKTYGVKLPELKVANFALIGWPDNKKAAISGLYDMQFLNLLGSHIDQSANQALGI
jgi:hypothetical protein